MTYRLSLADVGVTPSGTPPEMIGRAKNFNWEDRRVPEEKESEQCTTTPDTPGSR